MMNPKLPVGANESMQVFARWMLPTFGTYMVSVWVFSIFGRAVTDEWFLPLFALSAINGLVIFSLRHTSGSRTQ